MEQIIELKRIFNKKIAETLVNRGCSIHSIEKHTENESWMIFRFIDDDKFKQELHQLTQEIRRIKQQNRTLKQLT